jgi:hypothetical protein
VGEKHVELKPAGGARGFREAFRNRFFTFGVGRRKYFDD